MRRFLHCVHGSVETRAQVVNRLKQRAAAVSNDFAIASTFFADMALNLRGFVPGPMRNASAESWPA